jgi:hypothetical protein
MPERFTPPNQYRPIASNPIVDPLDTGTPFFSGLADSYRMSWMGQVVGAAENEGQAWQQATPDFDAKAHIPQGVRKLRALFRGRRHCR